MTVTATQIAKAKEFQINVEATAAAANKLDFPFYILLAVLDKESDGKNIFGHDAGSAMYGAGEVTEEKYLEFKRLVFEQGMTSNGVGPMQITYKGFFPIMEGRGLKPWVPADNILFGAELIQSYYDAAREAGLSHTEAIRKTGVRYNGGQAYGDDLVTKAELWRERVGIDDTLEAPVARTPVRNGSYRAILDGGTVTTKYKQPGDWQAGYHTGEDWNAPNDYGKPVYSAVEGKVVFVAASGGWGGAYGRHIIVQDVLGHRTAHCHLSADNVTVGDYVLAGRPIGKCGSTGNSTGSHVHVERRWSPFEYYDHHTPLRDFPRPGTKAIRTSHVMQGSFNGSVYWVQYALNKVAVVGDKKLRLSGDMGATMTDQVKKFQIQKCGDPGDGLLGPNQTKKLLDLAGMTGFTVY